MESRFWLSFVAVLVYTVHSPKVQALIDTLDRVVLALAGI